MKKMNDREKNASKATKTNVFGGGASSNETRRHGLLGGLFHSHRSSSAPSIQASIQPTPPESPSYILPPSQPGNRVSSSSFSQQRSEYAALDAIDPNWRETWGDDLKSMGITDDLIRENQDFIADYIKQQQASQNASAAPINGVENQRSKPPPPPPPPAARSESPVNVPAGRGRGAPPAPPPSRKAVPVAEPEPPREPTPPREPSPPRGPPPPRFAAPPPLPDAGKFAHTNNPPARRSHAGSVSNPGPPPPPRPPKTPMDSDYEPGESGSRFGVPPPFMGNRAPNPPPTPSRGPVPPPPPSRQTHTQSTHAVAPSSVPPPHHYPLRDRHRAARHPCRLPTREQSHLLQQEILYHLETCLPHPQETAGHHLLRLYHNRMRLPHHLYLSQTLLHHLPYPHHLVHHLHLHCHQDLEDLPLLLHHLQTEILAINQVYQLHQPYHKRQEAAQIFLLEFRKPVVLVR